MEAVIETLIIAKDFTPAPGARNVDEGSYSGEEFLNKVLKPRFERALAEDFTILVDLDNTEGYATSFLEEALGGLARIYGPEKVLNHLDFRSEDEPLLIDEIKMYIQEANL